MRAVAQRVKQAEVKVAGTTVGQISTGLLVYLGFGKLDVQADLTYLTNKIVNLRVFPDEDGRMNLSALTAKKDILLIPQFTLYGTVSKGYRPGFEAAAKPEEAAPLYLTAVNMIREYGLKVETGIFQADMEILSVQDGPVTILLDSEKKF